MGQASQRRLNEVNHSAKVAEERRIAREKLEAKEVIKEAKKKTSKKVSKKASKKVVKKSKK